MDSWTSSYFILHCWEAIFSENNSYPVEALHFGAVSVYEIAIVNKARFLTIRGLHLQSAENWSAGYTF